MIHWGLLGKKPPMLSSPLHFSAERGEKEGPYPNKLLLKICASAGWAQRNWWWAAKQVWRKLRPGVNQAKIIPLYYVTYTGIWLIHASSANCSSYALLVRDKIVLCWCTNNYRLQNLLVANSLGDHSNRIRHSQCMQKEFKYPLHGYSSSSSSSSSASLSHWVG